MDRVVGRIGTLVEIADASDGLVEMKAKDERGVRIGFFQVAESKLDDELIDDLLAWQARQSKSGAALSIVRPSASASSA